MGRNPEEIINLKKESGKTGYADIKRRVENYGVTLG